MTRLALIGLCNMGSDMAANQAKAGRTFSTFDLSSPAVARAGEAGGLRRNPAKTALSRGIHMPGFQPVLVRDPFDAARCE